MTLFLADGRVCLSNTPPSGRCAASPSEGTTGHSPARIRGGERAAAIYTVIETCKLNGVDPRAWLADVLSRLPCHPANRIADLLPWDWKKPAELAHAA